MAFGQDFLKAFFGNDYVKDYTHASKIFRTNGYQNSPKLKFLYHVYFTLNTIEIPTLSNIFEGTDQSTIGLLVKQVDLPKYKVDVETLNQYNRKRLVQTKIEYQPITVKFHDDNGDLIRNLWYNYYSYYYKDPSQAYRGQTPLNGSIGPSATLSNGFNYNNRDIYSNNRFVNDWGYVGESYSDGTNSQNGKPAFFKDISIYGFDQHKFYEYVLINPMIEEWNHDTYDYYQGDGVMENSVTIKYETVKYYSGAIGSTVVTQGSTNVQGFGNPNYYDQKQSPLTRPGGTRSIIGQGGLLDTGIGIIEDLQNGGVSGVVGAVQKAGTAYYTWKDVNVRAVAQQTAVDALKQITNNAVSGSPAIGTNVINGGVIAASVLSTGLGTGGIPTGGTVPGLPNTSVISGGIPSTGSALNKPIFPIPPGP